MPKQDNLPPQTWHIAVSGEPRAWHHRLVANGQRVCRVSAAWLSLLPVVVVVVANSRIHPPTLTRRKGIRTDLYLIGNYYDLVTLLLADPSTRLIAM